MQVEELELIAEAPYSRKPKLMQAGSPDAFQTPAHALLPLLPYLPKSARIWECAAGSGNLVRGLEAHGYAVVGSDVLDGQDFLTWQPDAWDVLMTNPPFSHKTAFLGRAYQLDKPFAFLLPLTTLEGKQRGKLFREYGVEIIIPDERYHFETPSGRTDGRAWFASVWVTHGLNIGQALTFWTDAPQGLLELSG